MDAYGVAAELPLDADRVEASWPCCSFRPYESPRRGFRQAGGRVAVGTDPAARDRRADYDAESCVRKREVSCGDYRKREGSGFKDRRTRGLAHTAPGPAWTSREAQTGTDGFNQDRRLFRLPRQAVGPSGSAGRRTDTAGPVRPVPALGPAGKSGRAHGRRTSPRSCPGDHVTAPCRTR